MNSDNWTHKRRNRNKNKNTNTRQTHAHYSAHIYKWWICLLQNFDSELLLIICFFFSSIRFTNDIHAYDPTELYIFLPLFHCHFIRACVCLCIFWIQHFCFHLKYTIISYHSTVQMMITIIMMCAASTRMGYGKMATAAATRKTKHLEKSRDLTSGNTTLPVRFFMY